MSLAKQTRKRNKRNPHCGDWNQEYEYETWDLNRLRIERTRKSNLDFELLFLGFGAFVEICSISEPPASIFDDRDGRSPSPQSFRWRTFRLNFKVLQKILLYTHWNSLLIRSKQRRWKWNILWFEFSTGGKPYPSL